MIDSLVILFPDWGRFDIVFSVFLGYKMFIGEGKKMHYSPLGNSYSLIYFGVLLIITPSSCFAYTMFVHKGLG